MLTQTASSYDATLDKFGRSIIQSLEARPLELKDAIITKEDFNSQGGHLLLELHHGRAIPKGVAGASDKPSGQEPPLADANPSSSAAGSDAPPEKKRKLELSDLIKKAQDYGSLPEAYSAQETAGQHKFLKQAEDVTGPSNLTLNAHVLANVARKYTQGTVLVCSSVKLIQRPLKEILVNSFGCTNSPVDNLLCVVGKKPKIRVVTTSDFLAVKLWPQDAINLSMLGHKARGQSVHDCMYLPPLAAALIAAASSF